MPPPKECPHEVMFGGLCADCGKNVRSLQAPLPRVRALHSRHDVWISNDEASSAGRTEYDALLAARRLVLVMDIDHTMLHALPLRRPLKPAAVPPHVTAVREGALHFLVKLRPGIEAFLRGMAELYQLHVYTHGSRAYAARVVAMLDPTGALFKDRIVSRDDCDTDALKTLTRIFPYRHDHVVVVDDKRGVWVGGRGGDSPVVKVPQYVFFSPGDKAVPPADTEASDAQVLGKTAQLLRMVHEGFFARHGGGGGGGGGGAKKRPREESPAGNGDKQDEEEGEEGAASITELLRVSAKRMRVDEESSRRTGRRDDGDEVPHDAPVAPAKEE